MLWQRQRSTMKGLNGLICLTVFLSETCTYVEAGNITFINPPPKYYNVALNKPTSQSSDVSSETNKGASYLAVDGNTDRDYFHGTCTHTDYEVMPWWMVDLERNYYVNSVKLVNRLNVHKDRLQNFKIEVSKDTNTWELCIHYPRTIRSQDMGWQMFYCPTTLVGRYVRVQLQDTNILTLCEVEIYGSFKP